MMRIALAGLAMLAAGAGIASPRAGAGTSTRSLVGTVGPEDTIVLTSNGHKVGALKPAATRSLCGTERAIMTSISPGPA
jgi:hypothetical protein